MKTHKIKSSGICRMPVLITLMFVIMGVFFFAGGITAHAAEPGPEAIQETMMETVIETLTVNDAWIAGDVINVTVSDNYTGEIQTFNLSLYDYANYSDEFISVQATDNMGRISNAIQIKNPFYLPPIDESLWNEFVPDSYENSDNPFTPDGTGTVLDNATSGDGKEFFTVEAGDKNIFYLIIDRQRNSENVYLLNAVTESDLLPLATKDEIISPGPEPPVPETSITIPELEEEPASKKSNGSVISLVLVIAALAGGAGYYLKIVRPKNEGDDDFDDDDYDDADGDEGMEYDGDGETGNGDDDGIEYLGESDLGD